MALTAVPFQPSTMIGLPHGAAAAYPDWALLNTTARLSELRNETTAECSTAEGQPVAVSFWLADPPAVSQFTVHCPGLDASGIPPYVICAEGAFVLFRVTLVGGSLHYFVYSAAGVGAGKNPSLYLLPGPDPYVGAFPTQELGLLPCGGEHYAVAFLDLEWPRDSHGETHYYASVFSSETNAWRRSKAAPPQLSDSEQALFETHANGSYKQITVGDSAVGWVDLTSGILLACNLFDETPVMKFIPFPASRARITYEDGGPYYAQERFCDVVCSGDLIRFVETDFDEPDRRTSGQGWRATTWNMKLDWDDWRKRCTANVDDVLVDQSYSALLPELVDEETQQLELKKLHFVFPTLSVRNDNLLYMMAKVDQRDDTAWFVVVIDMKCAVLESLVPVSTKPSDTITLYCPCAFPGYYPADDTVEIDNGSEDNDSMQELGDRYWRNDWCDESLESWDFSEEEDEDEEEDPVKKEEENEEGLVEKKEDDDDDDDKEDPVIRDEQECEAMKAFFCHETTAGAYMGNPVDDHDKYHEIWQWGFYPDDNEHPHKKKKRKRTKSSRRRMKRAQAQVLHRREKDFLHLIRFFCCILIAIIVRASIMAFPG